MPDILHRIGIKASPETVYAALTEQEGLAGWWTIETEVEPRVGAILQFRFGGRGFNDMKVLELVPGRRVKWECVDGAREWIGIDLRPEKQKDGSTIVLFAQRGW